MRRTVALLICLAALLATSCTQFPGTDTASSPRNDVLIDAMANDLIFEADPVTQDPGEAGCIATAAFGLIGATRLNDAGVTVESANLASADLTDEERASVAKVVADCTGVVTLSATTEDAAGRTVASGDEASSAAGAQDVTGQANQRELVDYMVTDLLSDPDAPTSSRAEARCMIEGTIALLGLDAAGVEDMAYSDRDSTRHEYNAMVEAYSLCADVVAGFASGLEGSGLYPAEANCVAEQFGRGNIVKMMRNSYDLPEGADLTAAEEVELFDAMDRCGIES